LVDTVALLDLTAEVMRPLKWQPMLDGSSRRAPLERDASA